MSDNNNVMDNTQEGVMLENIYKELETDIERILFLDRLSAAVDKYYLDSSPRKTS